MVPVKRRTITLKNIITEQYNYNTKDYKYNNHNKF